MRGDLSMQQDYIEDILTSSRLDYYISHGYNHMLVTNEEFDGLCIFTLNNSNGELSYEQKAICFIDGNLFFTDVSTVGASATLVYPIEGSISKKAKSIINKFIETETIEETDLLASMNNKAGIDYAFDMFPDLVQEGRKSGWRSLFKKERNRLITNGLFYLSTGMSCVEDDAYGSRKRTAKNVRPVLDFVADYTVIDIETTGLDPEEHEITELAAMRIRNHEVDTTFQILVNPKRPIPPEVVELTHITDDMVAGQPTLDEVIDIFKDFIGNDILVGHNIFGFDAAFINSKIPTSPITNKVIDTMWVARKVLKSRIDSFKLSSVCECLGVGVNNAHRALSDAEATYLCYENMAEYAKVNDISIESVRYRNWKASDIKPKEESVATEKPLNGKTFVITGELDYIDRKTAFQMIVDRGGTVKDGVTMKTDFLVLGECDGSTTKKRRALEMQRNGHKIQIINCEKFFDLIDYHR